MVLKNDPDVKRSIWRTDNNWTFFVRLYSGLRRLFLLRVNNYNKVKNVSPLRMLSSLWKTEDSLEKGFGEFTKYKTIDDFHVLVDNLLSKRN